MSDTTDDIAAAAADNAQADADAAAAAAAEAAAKPEPTAEETAAAEAAAAAAAEPKKPTRQERHVANLTRTAAEATRERDALLRRAEAAEALLAAGKGADPEKPLASPAARTAPATDVEARATQIAAERELQLGGGILRVGLGGLTGEAEVIEQTRGRE